MSINCYVLMARSENKINEDADWNVHCATLGLREAKAKAREWVKEMLGWNAKEPFVLIVKITNGIPYHGSHLIGECPVCHNAVETIYKTDGIKDHLAKPGDSAICKGSGLDIFIEREALQ